MDWSLTAVELRRVFNIMKLAKAKVENVLFYVTMLYRGYPGLTYIYDNQFTKNIDFDFFHI